MKKITWAGIDVGSANNVVRRWRAGAEDIARFGNDADGHRALLRWIGRSARVCVEATGVYHLQLCLFLSDAGVDVSVVNPRNAKDYAKSQSARSKTDKVDAGVLLDYCRRMDFVPWTRPSAAVLELREIGRRITELVHLRVQEKNRLHAKKTAAVSRVVAADVRVHLEHIDKRIHQMEKAATVLIETHHELAAGYKALVSARGVAHRSAVQLMAELAVLDPAMTVRQLVAHAGLDPREHTSGETVWKPARISKIGNARIRASLYMVALSAICFDRGAKTFYRQLIAAGKKKKVAIVAVMRKMLHGLWVCLQRHTVFDGTVLFAASLAQAESSDSAAAAHQPQRDEDHPQGRSEAQELRQQLEPRRAEAKSSRKKNAQAA